MQIIIIQNTSYHFEVTISLYSTLKKMGYDTFIYLCEKVLSENRHMQNEFITSYNLPIIDLDSINKDDSIGIVVSAYPYCSMPEIVPNINDSIFQIMNTNYLFFIRHRLKKHNNNNSTNNIVITNDNSIFLTPLASHINADYIWLTDCPIKPHANFNPCSVSLTVQGEFQFNHRNSVLINILANNLAHNKNVYWRIVGNQSKAFVNNNLANQHIYDIYENISQIELYNIFNLKTDIFVPCLDHNTRDGEYLNQRYSTTFLYACVLEKPIFSHELFEKVYNIPGIYYNETNIIDQFNKLLNIGFEEYSILTEQFGSIKVPMIKHNTSLLQKITNKCLKNL